MKLIQELHTILEEGEARRVPAGTFTPKKGAKDTGIDPDSLEFDWRNPNHNPSGKKPKKPGRHKQRTYNGKYANELKNYTIDNQSESFGYDVEPIKLPCESLDQLESEIKADPRAKKKTSEALQELHNFIVYGQELDMFSDDAPVADVLYKVESNKNGTLTVKYSYKLGFSKNYPDQTGKNEKVPRSGLLVIKAK